MEFPTKLGFSFEKETGNLVFEIAGMSLDLDLNADVTAAWFIPANLENLQIKNAGFRVVFSGRKNDPDCWLPIESQTSVEDYSVKLS